jgi:hypothetical protein
LAFSLDQGPLLGWLILQREDMDEVDRPMWTPVFNFSFPADEQWFGVGTGPRLIGKNPLYVLGASMLMVMINGSRY